MQSFRQLFLALVLSSALCAQLIPAGQLVPKGPNPPVVFVNGYQLICANSSFAGSFGDADTVLQASGRVSLFFDNCTQPNKPSIEFLGNALGRFLFALKYTDGTPVTQVDVVAHSMGGLIVRSYLAGKQDVTPSVFLPPNLIVRKLIFLATPHFGTALASFFGIDKQAQEITAGSQFLFDLNTWNDGTDDLRGTDALAIVGNGGTGLESGISGFDDGLVTLTSSSLAFARPGRTRILPVCHSNDALLKIGFCPVSTPSVAKIDSTNLTGQIILSFLSGTTDWQNLGQAVEANPRASTLAGLNIQAEDANGTPVSIASATAGSSLSLNSGQTAWSESLTPGSGTYVVKLSASTLGGTVKLSAAMVLPLIVKPGPVIARAIPAASAVFPFNVAAGELVSIYGSNLSQGGQAEVLVNGKAVPVTFVSPTQLNIIYETNAAGPSQLTVSNSSGQQTIQVLLAQAVPSVFSLDRSGTGPAAAINGITGQIVGPNAPLHARDYLSLFLTGLGMTTSRNNLDYSNIVPTVSVGGLDCPVSYAGRAPGFPGLDQINCQIPPGIAAGNAVPVIVTSNGRPSNTVTIVVAF